MLCMVAKPETKLEPAFSIRWDESESELLRKLRKKTGVKAVTELIRMSLMALAEKNGITG